MIFSLLVTSGCDYYVNYWTLQEFRRKHGEEVPLTQMQYLSIYSAFIGGLILVSHFQHHSPFDKSILLTNFNVFPVLHLP